MLQRALVEARHAGKMTQLEVASRVKKPQSYVSKYESGERRLDVVEFLDVCGALQIKPSVILQGIDKNGGEEDDLRALGN